MNRRLVPSACLLALLAFGCDSRPSSSTTDCEPSDWPGDPYTPSVRIPLETVQAAHDFTLGGEDASNCDGDPNVVDETSPTFLDDYRGSRSEGCGLVIFESVGWPRQRVYDAASGELVGYRQSDDVVSTFPGTTCSAASFVAGA